MSKSYIEIIQYGKPRIISLLDVRLVTKTYEPDIGTDDPVLLISYHHAPGMFITDNIDAVYLDIKDALEA